MTRRIAPSLGFTKKKQTLLPWSTAWGLSLELQSPPCSHSGSSDPTRFSLTNYSPVWPKITFASTVPTGGDVRSQFASRQQRRHDTHRPSPVFLPSACPDHRNLRIHFQQAKPGEKSLRHILLRPNSTQVASRWNHKKNKGIISSITTPDTAILSQNHQNPLAPSFLTDLTYPNPPTS